MSRISVNFASEISRLRERSFIMTREGDGDIERGFRKFLDNRKGSLKKIRGGAPKMCILQNQQ